MCVYVVLERLYPLTLFCFILTKMPCQEKGLVCPIMGGDGRSGNPDDLLINNSVSLRQCSSIINARWGFWGGMFQDS